jgi:hypothetical protein
VFRIQRPINIIGARAGKARGSEFARVSQRVEGRGKHIHVLHTGDHGSSPQGDFIWRLVLLYADGERRRFDFAYGVHVRNYWHHANETESSLSDPDSSFAWVGTSEESDRSGADLRVSRTTLANPRPEVEVISADYVSLLGQSSAYVLAVTLSDAGPGPKLPQQPSALGVPLLEFLLQNDARQPALGSSLDCVLECGNFSVRFVGAAADSAGRVIVDVPTAIVSTLRYQAHDSGGATRSGAIEITPAFKSTQLGISFARE